MSLDGQSWLSVPGWVPVAARFYVAHVEGGRSLRALARASGRCASTVMRQVRRLEGRRDDPLVDEALAALGRIAAPAAERPFPEVPVPMSVPLRSDIPLTDEATIAREGRRVLRRLCEPGALLAIAPDMEKAAVLREMADGATLRTAVVDRKVAQAFALKEWIACRKPGRVASYAVTAAGRAALRQLIEAEARDRPGLAEAASPFADQHRLWAERVIEDAEDGMPRPARVNLAESPVQTLGRRREKDGRPFLGPDLIAAAERLREDFELAQMGPRVAQNWERFLTAGERGGLSGRGPAEGPRLARERVALALRDLGPGLGDVALRVCCFLEGLEATEQRMGWSARSGKIVLRIALTRLRRHYEETGRLSPPIG